MRSKKYVLTALSLTLLCLGAAGISPAAELRTHTNSIGMEFVLIPAGSFLMGTDPNHMESRSYDAQRHTVTIRRTFGNEDSPRHSVTISRPFYLGKYEVTQVEWLEMMGDNPSQFEGWNNPVEQVSWQDAQEFIRRLNKKEGHTRYRLPTEAEWELAARGGTNTRWFFGDDGDAVGQYAWFDGNSVDKTLPLYGMTHPVGQKKPNQYGLYDIYGNVLEWVQDWYDKGYYAKSPETDPQGPLIGSNRVIRGGSWLHSAELCSSDDRGSSPPDAWGLTVGFRLALSPE